METGESRRIPSGAVADPRRDGIFRGAFVFGRAGRGRQTEYRRVPSTVAVRSPRAFVLARDSVLSDRPVTAANAADDEYSSPPARKSTAHVRR